MSIKQAFHRKALSTAQTSYSQTQKERDRDKWYMKNWRAISLLKLHTKISKALSEKLKLVPPSLTASHFNAFQIY